MMKKLQLQFYGHFVRMEDFILIKQIFNKLNKQNNMAQRNLKRHIRK